MLMRRQWKWALLSLTLVSVTLVGCASGSGSTTRLAPLHIARLQRLDAVSNLSQQGATTVRATLFQQGQQGAAKQQVLLSVVDGIAENGLAVVDLDGAHERQIPLTHNCLSDPAVTPDGQWVACVSDLVNGVANHLEVASLQANDTRHWDIPFSAPSIAYQLAWSPDGKYLALGGPASSQSQCAIDIYAAQSGYTHFSLLTSVTTPVFTDSSSCQLNAIGWSHDSARLLVAIGEGYSTVYVDDQTPIAALIQRGTAAYTIPATEFTALANSGPFDRFFAWNPYTDALAFIRGTSIAQLWLGVAGTTSPSALFTLPDKSATFSDVEWSPDGAKLALVIGPSQCLDCGVRSLPDVYLYTPPGGD